mmetsp:Transcript_2951/g.5741  ORF Transcript_2951/g.5741 Transcript_2951/m.5741 type:complete len:296 (-) Transcript_2951:1272-2159(-)
MHSKAQLEEVSHLPISRLLHLLIPSCIVRMHSFLCEITLLVPLLRDLLQGYGRFVGVTTRMHKDHALVASSHLIEDRIVADFIEFVHQLKLILLSQSHETHLQRYRSVRRIKIEKILILHSQEVCHILIVRQCCRQGNDSDGLAADLLISQRSGNDCLNHSSTILIQEMHFVYDDELHQLLKVVLIVPSRRARVSRHDVPLFRHSHNDVHLLQLLLREAHVASELRNHDAQWAQALRKLFDDFAHQGLHGCHVDNFEITANSTCRIHVLTDKSQNAEDSNVCLASTCWCADQHVL